MKKREGPIEPGVEVVDAEGGHPAGGDFDREWKAVEAPDDVRDGLVVVGVKAEAGLGAHRPFRGTDGTHWSVSTLAMPDFKAGTSQRGEAEESLAAEAERLSAGRHHREPGAGGGQRVDEAAHREAEVLTVVEHDQPTVVAR